MPNNEAAREFDAWLTTRPKCIQELAARISPWSRYSIHGTEPDYYIVYGYREDGTVSVVRFDGLTRKLMWRVVGVCPEDLTRLEEEKVGA